VGSAPDGAEAHLKDVFVLFKEEWEAMEPTTITHCWVKARLLQVEMEKRLTAQHGDYRHSLRAVSDHAAEMTTRFQSFELGGTFFGDAPPADRQVTVEMWLDLEIDAEAILDAADADLQRQSSSDDPMNTGSDSEGDEQ